MGIALPWLDNVRSDDANVGGYSALTFDELSAQISAAWDIEHTGDNHHGTITASGPISERARRTPQGVWIDLPYASTSFTSTAGQFVVRSTNLIAWAYMLVGTTLTMTWQITAAQQAVATTTMLKIALPAAATRIVFGTFAYDDNGTRGTGIARVNPDTGSGRVLILQKDLAASGTFSVSSNLSLAGQISVEIDSSL